MRSWLLRMFLMFVTRFRNDGQSVRDPPEPLWRRSSAGERNCRGACSFGSAVDVATTFAAGDSGHYNCRMKGGNWKTISSQRDFVNSHLEVVTDRVLTPSRSAPRTWTVVHRKAAVVIAPMTRDGKIILIRQERIPIREIIWEMPSGQIDHSVVGGIDPGQPAETIEQVALRELREEAGYELAKDGELIPLGHYFTSPGFTDERGHFFLARFVTPLPDYVRDESESILDCRPFAISEIRRMIADNEIRDANTLSLSARLWARGLLSALSF
jgi:ADP-ribose pyrophosphatase